jgi:beta-glucanase (GH16 family)
MNTINNNLITLFKSMSYFNISCFLFFLAVSCSSGDEAPKDTVSNLVVEVTLVGANEENPNGDGSGSIQVTATATNAVRYAFRVNTGEVQDSNTGTLQHSFLEEGTNTHSVVVWAYSESGDFINETLTITVYKSDAQFTNLVFFDEFETEGSPDAEKWHHQVIPPNNGSWHNGELQHYTDRIENSLVSNGTLKIKAIKEQYTYGASTKSYTSARLNAKHAFTFGKVEVRAKLPAAAGTWPAIWTLGANSNETGNFFGNQYGSGQWPGCGEIDIMEQTGWDKNTIISHFHWGDRTTGEYKNQGGTAPVTNASGDFHIYTMEWTGSSIKTFVDEELVYELPNSSEKPYDHPHYLLLNIALGGNLGGEVPENFTDATFEIDYVRVYQ